MVLGGVFIEFSCTFCVWFRGNFGVGFGDILACDLVSFGRGVWGHFGVWFVDTLAWVWGEFWRVVWGEF